MAAPRDPATGRREGSTLSPRAELGAIAPAAAPILMAVRSAVPCLRANFTACPKCGGQYERGQYPGQEAERRCYQCGFRWTITDGARRVLRAARGLG